MQPTLRFPEFKDEWSYNLFNNIVTNRSKKFNPSTEEPTNDIELDSIEQNTGRLLNTYMSNQFTSQKNIFNKNSVLYSKLRPYLNKYYYSQIEGVCSSEIWVLNTLNKGVLSNKFLYYFIQTNRFSSVANKSAGSKMPRADWGLVENIRLYKGSIEEQEKIGRFFSKIDQQIELEEKKLELLEQQKRGYMQKIFSQQLRFKDENGNDYPEWKKKKLDDVANYRRGSFPQPYGNKEWYDEKNGEPFVQVVDVDKNMKLHDKTKQKISDLAKPKSVKGFKGDIVVTLQGSIGRVAILQYDAYIDRTLLLINSFKIKMNKNYFNYVLYLLFLREKERAPGGTIKTITKAVLSNFEIDIPTLEEQNKIGMFFNEIDNLIELQNNKINHLKQRKQGLLQKMFV